MDKPGGLKPCPFCGCTETFIQENGYVRCPKCYEEPDYLTPEYWNSAYLWQELSHLKQELERKDKEILELKSALEGKK